MQTLSCISLRRHNRVKNSGVPAPVLAATGLAGAATGATLDSQSANSTSDSKALAALLGAGVGGGGAIVSAKGMGAIRDFLRRMRGPVAGLAGLGALGGAGALYAQEKMSSAGTALGTLGGTYWGLHSANEAGAGAEDALTAGLMGGGVGLVGGLAADQVVEGAFLGKREREKREMQKALQETREAYLREFARNAGQPRNLLGRVLRRGR